MKNLKNTIFRNVAFIMLGLVIFSCQKEEIQDEIQQEEVTLEKIQNLIKTKVPNATFPTEEKRMVRLEEAKKTGDYMSFETLEEFSKYLDEKNEYQQRGDVLTHEGDLTGGSGEDNYINIRHNIDWSTTHNTQFYMNACQGSQLNSYLSGFALGHEYYHLGGKLVNNTTTNSIQYEVSGVLHSESLIFGSWVSWDELLTYSGNVPCN